MNVTTIGVPEPPSGKIVTVVGIEPPEVIPVALEPPRVIVSIVNDSEAGDG